MGNQKKRRKSGKVKDPYAPEIVRAAFSLGAYIAYVTKRKRKRDDVLQRMLSVCKMEQDASKTRSARKT